MNTKTAKEKALNVKKKFEEKIGKLNIMRGKIEMLDELFETLDIQQKRDIVKKEFPNQKFTDDELWVGFALSEKAAVIISLIKKNA